MDQVYLQTYYLSIHTYLPTYTPNLKPSKLPSIQTIDHFTFKSSYLSTNLSIKILILLSLQIHPLSNNLIYLPS